MTFDVLGDLNWLAVIVATLAFFALGAAWYAPKVFGDVWMRAGGIQAPEQPQAAFYIVPSSPASSGPSRWRCWPRPRVPTRWARESCSVW
jgi:hypothetical protein